MKDEGERGKIIIDGGDEEERRKKDGKKGEYWEKEDWKERRE